jgi:hypothetical protein
MRWRVLDSSSSDQGQMVESCEHCIDPLGSIKCRKLCYYLKTCHLLQMSVGPTSLLVRQSVGQQSTNAPMPHSPLAR